MNIGKATDAEKLFQKINRRIQKTSRSPTERELNAVRAFVVQSQQPLQSVRLLQKEREERETDENFQIQKDKVIQDAKELDVKRAKYKKDQ